MTPHQKYSQIYFVLSYPTAGVVTFMDIKITVFGGVTLRGLLDWFPRFGGTCYVMVEKLFHSSV